MAKIDLAFQLTANANGMASGVAQADRELSKVGASAKATSSEFRQAAKITAEVRTPFEKYSDTVDKLDQMLQKGLLTQEVYGRAVAKAEAEMKAATSSMDGMARSAGIAERVANGVTTAMQGIGNATKSVSDAGVSVIKFGKEIAVTYAQWRLFQAIRNPAGLKDFAIGAFKGAMAARTLILAAKALGVGLALGGGAAGTAAAAVIGLSNPLIGGALLAVNLGKAFINAKDRAMEMAAGITAGTLSLNQLNAAMGAVQSQQVDNLAFAMEESAAAAIRSESAFSGFADVFVTPFIGALAAVQSGVANFGSGIASVMEGLTAVFSPVAQAIAPIFTMLGTLVEGVLKLGGVLLNTVGVVLKLAGAFVRTLLSPVIVGLTNTANLIRSGMGAAFDFVGSRIDSVSKKVEKFYAFMAKVPVIGGAFAGGNAPAAEVAAGAAAAAEESIASGTSTMDMDLQIYSARRANEEALAAAEQEAADDRLKMETDIYKARKANEEALQNARRKEEQDKLDAEMNMFAMRRENEQAIADANRKAQEEAAKVDEKMAEKQADIDQASADRAAALGSKSNEQLKANDIRSSEGIAQFLALATGREDPAIAENRKANLKLEEIRKELRALQAQKVEILGAA
jgi:hypothetical protein